MKDLLKKIDQKKSQLDALRPLPQELVKNLEQWFDIEQTYTSNALEGNTLTRSETAMVIEKGLTIGGKSIKDHLEARNLFYALDFIKGLANQKNISLKDILDIHNLILKGIDDKNAGIFRKVAVKISGSDVKLSDPSHLETDMNSFLKWLNSNQEHPVTKAAEAHLEFVTIHPFIDGNGRTARILMNLLLMQYGYPPAIIHPIDRKEYIDSLERAQLTGDTSDFYYLIYKMVDQSLNQYLEAAQKTIK